MSDETFQGFSARRISVPLIQPTPVTPTRPVQQPSSAPGTVSRSPAPFSPSHESNPFDSQDPPVTTPTRNPFRSPPRNTVTSPPAPAIPPVTPAFDTNTQLAGAIALLAQTLQRPAAVPDPAPRERNNVRDPDQFDGSDATKLRSFFAQLELVFKARPRTFESDEKKVTYAISYLKGTALQWFEPYLLEGDSVNPPLFMSDFEEFQQELRVNFGPYDATGQAEHDLENLRMQEGHRISKYITQFNRLATQVRWGLPALRYQFYKGLPARLKDRISEVGKPETLEGLRNLAQSLDHRYWERKTEQARESGSSGGKSGAKSPDSKLKSSGSGSSSHQPSGNQSSGTSGNRSSGNSSGKSSSSSSSKTPAKSYSDKLGKDGKLTQEERQRRFANNLCLFCGASGHKLNDCPKKNSTAAKGRAASASSAPASSATESAKIVEVSSETKK